jgi:histidinol-phosphatase (PHP family)
VAGRTLDEIVEPYFTEVVAAARSGLFDTIGHLDVVKRYIHPHVVPAQLADRPDLYEPALRALVESGTALEVNSSGLHDAVAETYPAGPIVARQRSCAGRGHRQLVICDGNLKI